MIHDVFYKKIDTEYGTITIKVTEIDGVYKGEILESDTRLCVFTEDFDSCIKLAENAFKISLNLWLRSELFEIFSFND